ncbi:MAG TPA: hypothetical protein DDW52_24050 [Planctomycetaceae bacterium]|nr:hypothetical protein [Planctomycetaceae bacterium]
MWKRTIPFKVDIAGVIEIMGSSLYSRIDTPIRELIQNGHDAIMRRRTADLEYSGRIDVVQNVDRGTITFSDDGIGLTAEEAESYLGTLGIGITGILKGRQGLEAAEHNTGSGDDLIGQFGIGLFSAFMLADRLSVESLSVAGGEAVRWEAGPGTEIQLSQGTRTTPGTEITLTLKKHLEKFASEEQLLEFAIKQFADFIPIPIHINGASARVNVIQAAWFDSTLQRSDVEMEIASYFDESPLDVIPIHTASPVTIQGALYVSPQRTPGFTDDSVVAATIRRMVISRNIQDLLPPWASFLRGILELPDCSPTASREDLVRDQHFELTRRVLSDAIFEHFEELAQQQPERLEAIVNWHRFTLAGSALAEPLLRKILRDSYRFLTSDGELTFDEILKKSEADPIAESEAEYVIWCNADRRQEAYLSELFRSGQSICVHAIRSFEEGLLAALIADTTDAIVDLRIASPSSPGFAESILGMHDLEEATPDWQEYFDASEVKVSIASFATSQPVMAFLNERYELSKTLESLKNTGDIPRGFQRLIDAHFDAAPAGQNEVILNRQHRLIGRALSKGTRSPLANVTRLLVHNALQSAGAQTPRGAKSQLADDLDWIAEMLWGRD